MARQSFVRTLASDVRFEGTTRCPRPPEDKGVE
eukprot:CAMPEP_0181536180 /NCGR_PEP_ID=MMETSP1110-20121109/74687_1 /TAXON_ID=174948 /ORGANISM="Symbiodinium sp., Strain CCMP421" /LENGTH=32 /DNA_ID= /DNA_START= /DNA_END= /DNA_ORIENTATION=